MGFLTALWGAVKAVPVLDKWADQIIHVVKEYQYKKDVKDLDEAFKEAEEFNTEKLARELGEHL